MITRKNCSWFCLFGIALLAISGCGDDYNLSSLVHSLEIDGPFGIRGDYERPKVGFRGILIVTAENDAGDGFDHISGAEIYKDIKWKSSNESIAKVSTDRSVLGTIHDPDLNDNLSRIAVVWYKRPGQVVISASYHNLTVAETLVVK